MKKFLFLLGCLAILTAYLSGQCDTDLTPVHDQQLKYKFRNNRCEGFYNSDITSYSLQLANLTCGQVSYTLSESEVIQVLPLFDNNCQVQIQASALHLRKYYRMDSEISSDKSLNWPVNEVLLPANLSANKIGVCGWIKSEDESIATVIPLKVNSLETPVSGCNKLLLIFTSNIDLDRITYRIGSVNGDNSGNIQELPRQVFYAGNPIQMMLDISMLDGKQLFFIAGKVYNPGTEDKYEAAEWIRYFFYIELPLKP
jgi:hypothetical protein